MSLAGRSVRRLSEIKRHHPYSFQRSPVMAPGTPTIAPSQCMPHCPRPPAPHHKIAAGGMLCHPYPMDNEHHHKQLARLRVFASCGAVAMCLAASPAFASNFDGLFRIFWWMAFAMSVVCTTIAYGATVMIKNP